MIEACLQPGVSIAAVALANQLNTNFVRKWVKAHLEQSQVPMGDAATSAAPAVAATFVPVTVQASPVESPADIRVEIRRSETVVQITWPVSQSSICAQWLRELLA